MYTVIQSEEFQAWLDALKDIKAQAQIAARIDSAARGNLGDMKSVGNKISEMRINVGPGYRLYLTRCGKQLIVMLGGGDKSSQARDIKRMQKLIALME